MSINVVCPLKQLQSQYTAKPYLSAGSTSSGVWATTVVWVSVPLLLKTFVSSGDKHLKHILHHAALHCNMNSSCCCFVSIGYSISFSQLCLVFPSVIDSEVTIEVFGTEILVLNSIFWYCNNTKAHQSFSPHPSLFYSLSLSLSPTTRIEWLWIRWRCYRGSDQVDTASAGLRCW